MPRIDGCAKLHLCLNVGLAICALNDSLFIRSLLSLILVRTVLNNSYFCSLSLLKFVFHLVFLILQLKNYHSCSHKTNDDNFLFHFNYENN